LIDGGDDTGVESGGRIDGSLLPMSVPSPGTFINASMANPPVLLAGHGMYPQVVAMTQVKNKPRCAAAECGSFVLWGIYRRHRREHYA
jgi:hypothetical protein